MDVKHSRSASGLPSAVAAAGLPHVLSDAGLTALDDDDVTPMPAPEPIETPAIDAANGVNGGPAGSPSSSSSSSSASSASSSEWKQNPVITPFVGAEFDESGYVANAIAAAESTSALIGRLSHGVADMQQLIRARVGADHKALLASTAQVGALETKLIALHAQISTLHATCLK